MDVKSYIQGLNLNELLDIRNNFTTLREVCQRFGVSELDLFRVINELEQSPKRKIERTRKNKSSNGKVAKKRVIKDKGFNGPTEYMRYKELRYEGLDHISVVERLGVDPQIAKGYNFAWKRYEQGKIPPEKIREESVLKKNPRDIVLNVYNQLRKRNSGKIITDFSALVGQVEIDMNKSGVSYDKNCSLEAYVANVLYELAEERA